MRTHKPALIACHDRLRLIIQQSNCFVIVERGRTFQNMQTERSTTLLLTNNRSGIQLTVAEGSAKNWDMGLLAAWAMAAG